MESKTDKILAAAFRLIHQHGFKKVTMSDIAEAAELSRPTLYAEFANKEAVISAICAQHVARAYAEVAARLPRAKSLKAQLALVFDIWIIVPFASVADSPSGLDLLGNIASYAPAATTALYAQFERHLTALLEPAMPGKRAMTAADIAHILMLATKGLKASTSTVAELRRMTDGLIAMAVATAS